VKGTAKPDDPCRLSNASGGDRACAKVSVKIK